MRRGTDVDRVIERIAARCNRTVPWDELSAAGVTHRAVEHRLAIGRLYRHHKGVYLLEPPHQVSRLTLMTAAVAACGPDAVLSYRSAAELWGCSNRGRVRSTSPSSAVTPGCGTGSGATAAGRLRRRRCPRNEASA